MNSLSAFSVGRDGDPYCGEAISWQPVKYVNRDFGYKAAFGDAVEIQPIPSNQRRVKYVVDLVWKEKNKMARVFCSSNQLYWALVEGQNLSLAPFFFETVQITK